MRTCHNTTLVARHLQARDREDARHAAIDAIVAQYDSMTVDQLLRRLASRCPAACELLTNTLDEVAQHELEHEDY